MKKQLNAILSLLLLIVIPNVSFSQVYPPGTFSIAGVNVFCGGATTVVTPMINDMAKASPGFIYLHPNLNSFPVGVMFFTYAHECGHQIYGWNEIASDMFAVRLGREQGFIDEDVIREVCQALWMSPGDWTHLPGPQRCQLLYNTFAE